MDQNFLYSVLQMFFGLVQAGIYALLLLWSLRIVGGLPLDKYFKKVGFYHTLVPALVLTAFASMAVNFVLDLLFSFPLDFTQGGWLPPLLKFLEGVALLVVIFKVYRQFGASPKS